MKAPTKRRLIELVPPPSMLERRLVAYRTMLMEDAWEIIKPVYRLKLNVLHERHPEIEERYEMMMMQRVHLLTERIEKEREARSIFEDVQQPVSTSA